MAQFCVYCGAQLHDQGEYCPVCGKSSIPAPNDPAAGVQPVILPPEEERPFFQDGTVTITSTRFTVPGQVFAMSEVRGVRVERTDSLGSWPTALYLLALGAFVARLYRFGFVLLIVGTLLKMFFRPKFALVFDSPSGQVRAYTSPDRDYIHQILDALKQAILFRQ
jgi:hypothetical protein